MTVAYPQAFTMSALGISANSITLFISVFPVKIIIREWLFVYTYYNNKKNQTVDIVNKSKHYKWGVD